MWWIVAGTRPELIKLAPVWAQMRAPWRLVLTGQHTDLLRGLPRPPQTLDLGLASDNHPYRYVERVTRVLGQQAAAPLGVLVQGDTASALAGARYGAAHGLPVVHVEAGLRTYQADPWPEEPFRVEIDGLATLRCAPTARALAHLIAEGRVRGSVVTGNTVVDALAGTRRAASRSGILLTLHRRESFGAPMAAILAGLPREEAITWPVHPNPAVREAAATCAGIRCIAPLPRAAFLDALTHARCVVTDSGGVIEEAATLGIPCVIARDHTERLEAVDAGVAQLAGRTAEGIATATAWALNATIQPSRCFGDGTASRQIAALLPALS